MRRLCTTALVLASAASGCQGLGPAPAANPSPALPLGWYSPPALASPLPPPPPPPPDPGGGAGPDDESPVSPPAAPAGGGALGPVDASNEPAFLSGTPAAPPGGGGPAPPGLGPPPAPPANGPAPAAPPRAFRVLHRHGGGGISGVLKAKACVGLFTLYQDGFRFVTERTPDKRRDNRRFPFSHVAKVQMKAKGTTLHIEAGGEDWDFSGRPTDLALLYSALLARRLPGAH